MYYLSCDVCKKMLTNPKSGKNYYTMKQFHICRKCMLTLKRDMQDKAEAENKTYDFLAKKDEFWAAVSRKCSR
ncbi:MAG: hypothetical protein FWE72_06055 [Spirochaetaceae bacterium]|nr:hypothetical protein [Spirochaetaceae bacterium]